MPASAIAVRPKRIVDFIAIQFVAVVGIYSDVMISVARQRIGLPPRTSTVLLDVGQYARGAVQRTALNR